MRRDGAAALAFAAVATLMTACGGTGASRTDAAPGADAPAETAGTACDPAAQNCGAGQKCDFGCQGAMAVVACWPATDGGVVGTTCTTVATCSAGTACIAISTAGTVCRKYCDTDGDCPTGERCHNDTVTVSCGTPATPLSLHFCHL
jgi:hypothetical protein